MSKKKLKKHVAKSNVNKTFKPFLLEGLKHAVFGYLFLLIGLAVLALCCVKKDISPQAVKISSYTICALSFLITGFMSGYHPIFSPIKDGCISGLFLLIALFILLLFVSRGDMGLYSLILICFGLILPPVSSLFIQKIK